jgi:hypothetical protein
VRLSIAAFLVLPLACPAFAEEYPVVNLVAPYGAIEVHPLPPVGVAAPEPHAGEAEVEEGDDLRSADLKRQEIAYFGSETPGTIVVDTAHTHLFLVMEGGRAMRYGIGVGREGFTWSGRERISRMAEWPDWYPPKEMIERQPYLPRVMAGGMGNPLGARAMYLGNSLYRIHGTNQPHTIGKYVSSGCIRLTNEDIEDLYGRVKIGAEVVVLQADGSLPPRSVPKSAHGRISAPLLTHKLVTGSTVGMAIGNTSAAMPTAVRVAIPRARPAVAQRTDLWGKVANASAKHVVGSGGKAEKAEARAAAKSARKASSKPKA